jgi:prepilin-type N-terminal cleavage/methylation domain-containing protein
MVIAARKVNGLSLIELLISISILAAITALTSYFFSFAGNLWKDRDDSFQSSFDRYRRIDLLNLAISNSLPWVVRKKEGDFGFYFLGRDEGLTLVTGSPIFNPGYPAVIRIFRESSTDGKWRLVYEEASLSDIRPFTADTVLPFKNRLIVADGLTEVSFRYFGYASLAASISDETSQAANKKEWLSDFDGLLRSYHPEKIEIGLNGSAVVFSLPVKAASLVSQFSDPAI